MGGGGWGGAWGWGYTSDCANREQCPESCSAKHCLGSIQRWACIHSYIRTYIRIYVHSCSHTTILNHTFYTVIQSCSCTVVHTIIYKHIHSYTIIQRGRTINQTINRACFRHRPHTEANRENSNSEQLRPPQEHSEFPDHLYNKHSKTIPRLLQGHPQGPKSDDSSALHEGYARRERHLRIPVERCTRPIRPRT